MSRALAFEAFAGRTLTLQLFEDVANAAELKRRIVAKELPVEAAFLDADSVPHIFLVHLAAFKALAAQKEGALLTNSIYSDVIVNLSGSRHISAALATFGIGDASARVLVASLDASATELQAVRDAVAGKQVEVPDEVGGADEARMRKAFKVSAAELEVGSLTDAAICKAAMQER